MLSCISRFLALFRVASRPQTPMVALTAEEYTEQDHFIRIKNFPQSSEGEVSICRSDRTGKVVVVKHPRPERKANGSGKGPVYLYPNEAKMLQSLRPHPNIIRLFGVEKSFEVGRWLLGLEYCSGGDLLDQTTHFSDLAKKDYGAYPALQFHRGSFKKAIGKPLIVDADLLTPELFLLHLAISLIDALAFIHHGLRRGPSGSYVADEKHIAIIHCDFKPDNIFVRWSASGTQFGLPDIVLADFGAAQLASESRGTAGTPGYHAPEVQKVYDLKYSRPREYRRMLGQAIMTTKSDIYSFAQTVYLCATFSHWQTGSNPDTLILPAAYTDGQHLRHMATMLAWCFEMKPWKRPSAKDLLDVAEQFRAQRKKLFQLHGSLPQSVWHQGP